MKLGMLALRATVGALFFGHGAQKLFGWFGGPGPQGTGQVFESLGLRPGKRNAIAAGAAEAGGGVLLGLGLCTPLAAALLTGSMTTAIRTVHLEKGPWVTEGGYEYPAVLIALVFALTDAGPGDWSVDGLGGRPRWGVPWALAAVAAGAAGSHLAIEAGKRAVPAATPPQAPEAEPAAAAEGESAPA